MYHILLLLLLSCFNCFSETWVHPNGKQTTYLFAPGIHATERQIAKYCNSYDASTGQRVYVGKHINVIGSNATAINFPEINLDSTNSFSFGAHIACPHYMFNQLYTGIAQIRRLLEDSYENTFIQKASSTECVKNPSINRKALSLAQEADIDCLSQTYDAQAKHDNAMVLYGASRGAATIFNFMATEYLKKEIKTVKAVILEGCFDQTVSILKSKLGSYASSSYAQYAAQKLFSCIYPNHNLDGIQPIKVVEQFPHDVPLLLITSKIDKIVPAVCTWNLYHELKKAGHPHLYILELKHSRHPHYMNDNEYDALFYESVVHAFYKKYGLPYNPEKIMLGDAILAQCQP
ncbi:MAG: alpha/beta hydrolase family protein [Candidatus Babeliales bacterium]